MPKALLTLLAVVVLAGGLVCALLGLRFAWAVRDLQRLQDQSAAVNFRRAAIQALANDAAEYAKKNPALLPILDAAAARQRALKTSPSPAAPAKH